MEPSCQCHNGWFMNHGPGVSCLPRESNRSEFHLDVCSRANATPKARRWASVKRSSQAQVLVESYRLRFFSL